MRRANEGIVIDKGRKILTDSEAEGSIKGEPAFIGRPEGAAVYHGFRIIDESETEGWRLGFISEFIDSEYGDGFVMHLTTLDPV